MHLLVVFQALRVGHQRHLGLMLKAPLASLEGGRKREDLRPMLDGHNPARREAGAVARTVHLIENRHLGIAGPEKIGMKGMAEPRHIHGAGRRGQGLGQHLSAENPLYRHGGRETAEDVFFDSLQVVQVQETKQCAVRHVYQPTKRNVAITYWRTCGKCPRRRSTALRFEKLSVPRRCMLGSVAFRAVAPVSQGPIKTLECGALSAAKQHARWRHLAGSSL